MTPVLWLALPGVDETGDPVRIEPRCCWDRARLRQKLTPRSVTCRGHDRHLARGDDMAQPRRHPRKTPRGDILGRFEVFIDRDGPMSERLGSRCWLWTGEHNGGGYSWWPVDGRSVMVHRWAYERWVGPIPEGLTLDHLCNRPGCVNPDHCEPVTQRENALRGVTNATAINARKTHCPSGHPYEGDNLYVTPRGWRYCRTCRSEQLKERRRKQRS